MSPRYFGDLIIKETGKTAQEYIRAKVMDVAKDGYLPKVKPLAKLQMI